MNTPSEREWLEGVDDPLQALWDERLADAWADCVAQGEATGGSLSEGTA